MVGVDVQPRACRAQLCGDRRILLRHKVLQRRCAGGRGQDHDQDVGLPELLLQVVLEPSADGWDSTMTAYPAVVSAAGRMYLFYNGNDFGRAGFGYAVRTDPA